MSHTRRWESATAGLAGLEIASNPLQPYAVAEALGRLDAGACDCFAFVLVPLATTDRFGAIAAVEALRPFVDRVRTCLAVDMATLQIIDSRWLDRQGIGLLLDAVDAETPPAAIIRDAVEAVRFSNAFFSATSRDLRMSAVLQSTLSLTKDLGLTTLSAPTHVGVLPPAVAALLDYAPADCHLFGENGTVLAPSSQQRRVIQA